MSETCDTVVPEAAPRYMTFTPGLIWIWSTPPRMAAASFERNGFQALYSIFVSPSWKTTKMKSLLLTLPKLTILFKLDLWIMNLDFYNSSKRPWTWQQWLENNGDNLTSLPFKLYLHTDPLLPVHWLSNHHVFGYKGIFLPSADKYSWIHKQIYSQHVNKHTKSTVQPTILQVNTSCDVADGT